MPRVLIATLLGLTGFVVYVAVALALADQIGAWPWGALLWVVQLLYFIVAGMLWVIPARWLMLWAARGRQERAG